MGKRELTIGLDLGTTSVKAIMFDTAGNLIAESEQMISTHAPETDWKEQNPDQIERSSVKAIREAVDSADVQADELLSVGISCAMHSLICVDRDGEALSPMIIWSDGRSSDQADRLQQKNGQDIYMKTGTPIHPMSPFVKLMWMQENDYEPYQDATYIMSMKEYLLQKWFNRRIIDYSMASATGLLNIKTLDWDDDVLEQTGIVREQLSAIVPPTEVLTGLEESVARDMQVSPQLPFVIGAADGQLANLGDGAISPGEVAISFGTSGAIRQFITSNQVNEKQETFTYAFTEDMAIIGGATNNGGIALQWFKDLLSFEGSHQDFIAGAENVEPGADGLLFLPYVNGERAPLWNQRAKGNFYGLSVGHKKEHMVRAVLEGLTFNIYQIGQSLEEVAGKPEKISLNGGLAKSSLFVQILADVFGQEIHLSDTHHGAAWGAAWTSLLGIKKVDSFEAIKKIKPSENVVKPDQSNHATYADIYTTYEKLVKDLSVYFT